MSSSCLRIYGKLFSLLAFALSPALAQELPEELSLNLKKGEEIQVVDAAGKVIQGKFEGISNATLTLNSNLGSRTLPGSAIREIRKAHQDPWWNGCLIGAASGAAAGIISTRLACGADDSECQAISTAAFVLPGIGAGAAIGALVDRSIKKFETIFPVPGASGRTTLRISPFVQKNSKGMYVSLVF